MLIQPDVISRKLSTYLCCYKFRILCSYLLDKSHNWDKNHHSWMYYNVPLLGR